MFLPCCRFLWTLPSSSQEKTTPLCCTPKLLERRGTSTLRRSRILESEANFQATSSQCYFRLHFFLPSGHTNASKCVITKLLSEPLCLLAKYTFLVAVGWFCSIMPWITVREASCAGLVSNANASSLFHLASFKFERFNVPAICPIFCSLCRPCKFKMRHFWRGGWLKIHFSALLNRFLIHLTSPEILLCQELVKLTGHNFNIWWTILLSLGP